jgi:hypothetical protein
MSPLSAPNSQPEVKMDIPELAPLTPRGNVTYIMVEENLKQLS